MSRYIDADALKEQLRNGYKQGFFDLPDGVLFEIDDTPSADVVEVVRKGSTLSVCIVLPEKVNKFQQFMYKLCFGWEYTEGEYHD